MAVSLCWSRLRDGRDLHPQEQTTGPWDTCAGRPCRVLLGWVRDDNPGATRFRLLGRALAVLIAGGLVWLLLGGEVGCGPACPWRRPGRGAPIYVVMHVLLTLVPVSKNLLSGVAGALFGLAGGIAISWLASMLSALVGFAIARRARWPGAVVEELFFRRVQATLFRSRRRIVLSPGPGPSMSAAPWVAVSPLLAARAGDRRYDDWSCALARVEDVMRDAASRRRSWPADAGVPRHVLSLMGRALSAQSLRLPRGHARRHRAGRLNVPSVCSARLSAAIFAAAVALVVRPSRWACCSVGARMTLGAGALVKPEPRPRPRRCGSGARGSGGAEKLRR